MKVTCSECEKCVHKEINFEGVGRLPVGFCLVFYEFITGKELREPFDLDNCDEYVPCKA